jgi:hypothetical protein
LKRYRLLGFDFDTRVRSLDPIPDEWEEQVKVLHRANRERTLAGLKDEYGSRGFDQKLQNFVDLGAKPFSIIAFHNRFYAQARSAFVAGQYYPALTSIAALGERVLNHLVLGLREHFKASEIYRRVYRKDSFDNWELALDALHEWQILTPEAEAHFRLLWRQRNEALHFNPGTEVNDRLLALQALQLFGQIVECQFACFGALPWLFTPPGEVYIRRDWERQQFIRLVYLPNALHVGYKHKVVSAFPWRIEDNEDYEAREVSDEDFTDLRVQHQNAASQETPTKRRILNGFFIRVATRWRPARVSCRVAGRAG